MEQIGSEAKIYATLVSPFKRMPMLSLEKSSGSILRFGLLMFLSLLILVAQSQTTVVINPVKDNTLYESGTGALSNGSGISMFAGKTNQGLVRRALIKFDVISNVPAGATITSATLTFKLDKSVPTAESVSIHTVSADWGEALSNAGSTSDGDGDRKSVV